MTGGAGWAEAAAALSRGWSPAVVNRLTAYVELIVKWNQVYNLTAVRDPVAMLTQHVADSLAVVPHLPAGPLIDVGTGAGLPGVPVALVEPARAVTVLDSSQKKTSFIKQVVIELGLTNVTVVCARAERYRPPEGYAVVISRAFADLKSFVTVAGHLCAPGGIIAAMKGQYPADELAALPADFSAREVVRLEVPGLAAERHLVLIEHAHPPENPH